MLGFQLMIACTIIGSGILFGSNAVKTVSMLWAMETIIMVFAPWLLVLQFINIGISFVIGYLVGLIRDLF